MKIKSIFVLLLSLVLFISCAGIPPQKQNLRQDSQDLIQEAVDRIGITGLSAAVVYDGELLFTRGFGYSNSEGEAVTEDTLFQIGSVSKIMTALAVMKLAEESVVDLDEDIRLYLKDFNPKLLRPDDAPVTIRNLLTHHSGIPSDYMKDFELEEYDPDYFMNMSTLLSQEYLTGMSGTVFAYNNAGFSLLGELIGTVSGMSYADYLEQKIFRPAGMKDALVSLTDRNTAGVSGGFTAGEAEELKFIRDIPAGSILLSSRDMGALMDELLSCSRGESSLILRPETLRSMFIRQNGDVFLDYDFEMGLTFWLKDFHNRLMVEHGGTIPPFRSSMKLLPEEGIGVFISANDNIIDDIALNSLCEEVLALLIAADQTPNGTVDPERLPVIPSEKEITRLAGYYNVGNFGLFRMEAREGQLWADFSHMGINAPIIFFSDNNMEVEGMGIRFIPSSPGNHESGILFCYWGNFFIGPVLPVAQYSLPNSWKPRMGRYIAEHPVTVGVAINAVSLSYDPDVESMILTLEVMGQESPMALNILSDSLLQVQGYGRNLGSVLEHHSTDSQETLTYGGIKFLKEE